jgi:hypothetical protein
LEEIFVFSVSCVPEKLTRKDEEIGEAGAMAAGAGMVGE